jgi:hypothetical protein
MIFYLKYQHKKKVGVLSTLTRLGLIFMSKIHPLIKLFLMHRKKCKIS